MDILILIFCSLVTYFFGTIIVLFNSIHNLQKILCKIALLFSIQNGNLIILFFLMIFINWLNIFIENIIITSFNIFIKEFLIIFLFVSLQ